MSTKPEEIITQFTVEMYNAQTGIWSRAEGPFGEDKAYESLDEVKSVIKGYHANGSFLQYTKVRMQKSVTETTTTTTEDV